MKRFFDDYEYAWEYNFPFGEDFLKSIFGDNYKMIYSKEGDGIHNIILMDGKIYSAALKTTTSLPPHDGKRAFRDETKDKIIDAIVQKLKDNNIIYSTTGGKTINFYYNKIYFKIEVVKKKEMPK